MTLDRFDPGRDQAGAADRAPSALLPGDVLVPCTFSRSGGAPDAVVQSEAELHRCFQVSDGFSLELQEACRCWMLRRSFWWFQAVQQVVSSRQTLDLSQLLKIRAQVLCCQQPDAAGFSLRWSAVCPAVPVDVQPVRAVPIVPTALLRSLTNIGRPAPQAGHQRG